MTRHPSPTQTSDPSCTDSTGSLYRFYQCYQCMMGRWVAWVTLSSILLGLPASSAGKPSLPVGYMLYNDAIDELYKKVCARMRAALCRPPPLAARRHCCHPHTSRACPPAQEIAPRIPATEHYLDYTGSGLYWNSQVAAAVKELQSAVYGNPHSTNPSSLRTEALVEQVRGGWARARGEQGCGGRPRQARRSAVVVHLTPTSLPHDNSPLQVRSLLLDFFGADPAQYDVS